MFVDQTTGGLNVCSGQFLQIVPVRGDGIEMQIICGSARRRGGCTVQSLQSLGFILSFAVTLQHTEISHAILLTAQLLRFFENNTVFLVF